MALPNTFYPHSIKFNASPNVVQLSDSSPSRGYQVIRDSNASEAVPCFIGASESQPSISFATTAIKELATLLAAGEEGVCSDLSAGDVTAFYRAGKPHGIREAVGDLDHISAVLASSAMLTLNSLSAQQGAFASLAGLLTGGKSSGDPMVITGSQAVTAGNCANVYKLGPVLFNGAAINGVTGVNLNGGVSVQSVMSDGEPYPGFVGVDRVEPTVTVTTLDMNELADATSGGNELTEAIIWLRRMSETGYQYGDGTANHIKITLSGGIKLVDTASSSPVSTDVMFHIKKVGTDPVIEWETDQLLA